MSGSTEAKPTPPGTKNPDKFLYSRPGQEARTRNRRKTEKENRRETIAKRTRTKHKTQTGKRPRNKARTRTKHKTAAEPGANQDKTMTHIIRIENLADLDRAAAAFLSEIGDARIIAFNAPLGAGKTTFTAALCRRLGVAEVVNSPTFTILNEYLTASGDFVYHFDFYRIKDIREAVDIGLDDYLYSGSLCLIEWPENVGALLPPETLRVDITVAPDLSRTLTWSDPA